MEKNSVGSQTRQISFLPEGSFGIAAKSSGLALRRLLLSPVRLHPRVRVVGVALAELLLSSKVPANLGDLNKSCFKLSFNSSTDHG